MLNKTSESESESICIYDSEIFVHSCQVETTRETIMNYCKINHTDHHFGMYFLMNIISEFYSVTVT